jgi:hypothetical protein
VCGSLTPSALPRGSYHKLRRVRAACTPPSECPAGSSGPLDATIGDARGIATRIRREC